MPVLFEFTQITPKYQIELLKFVNQLSLIVHVSVPQTIGNTFYIEKNQSLIITLRKKFTRQPLA